VGEMIKDILGMAVVGIVMAGGRSEPVGRPGRVVWEAANRVQRVEFMVSVDAVLRAIKKIFRWFKRR